ncbi:hypothetical protein [Kytococcus sedentarius]|uniref:hypothetical protein n=1 Tax=Kytococcus sedentarius TaxID=1276 RepID=UPI0035BC8806
MTRQPLTPRPRARTALLRSAAVVLAASSLAACSPGDTAEQAAGEQESSVTSAETGSTSGSAESASDSTSATQPADSASTADSASSESPTGDSTSGETSPAGDPTEGDSSTEGDASASEAEADPQEGSGDEHTGSDWVQRPATQEVEGPAAEADFAAGLKAYNTLEEMTLGKEVRKLPRTATQVATEDVIEEKNERLSSRGADYLEGGEDAVILEGAYRSEGFVQFDVCTRQGMTYHHPDNDGPVEDHSMVETVSAQRIDGRWKVTDINDHRLPETCPLPGQDAWEEPGLKQNPDTAAEYEKIAKTFDALVDSNMAPGATTLSPEDAALLTDEIAEAFNKGAAKPAGPQGELVGTGSAQLLRGVLLRDYEMPERQDHAAIDVCWTGDYHRELPDGSQGEDPENPLTQGKGLVAHIFAVRNQGEDWKIASWRGMEENVC